MPQITAHYLCSLTSNRATIWPPAADTSIFSARLLSRVLDRRAPAVPATSIVTVNPVCRNLSWYQESEFRADRIVAEVNNGGDLVEDVIRVIDRNVSYKAVHASRGKIVRAEPISALYEQKRVHHVGLFAELETQMCSFVPDNFDGSPDRVDALVWALTELMVDREPTPNIRLLSN